MAANAAGGGGGEPRIRFGEKVAIRHYDPREDPAVNRMGVATARPQQEGRLIPNIPVLLQNNKNTRKKAGLPAGHPLRGTPSFTGANRAAASAEMKRGVNMPPIKKLQANIYRELKKKILTDLLAKNPTLPIHIADRLATQDAAVQYKRLKITLNNAHAVALNTQDEVAAQYNAPPAPPPAPPAAAGGGAAAPAVPARQPISILKRRANNTANGGAKGGKRRTRRRHTRRRKN